MVYTIPPHVPALPPPAAQPKDADVVTRSLIGAAVVGATDEAARLAKVSATQIAGGEAAVTPVAGVLDVFA